MGKNMNKPVAYCVTKDNHIECLCFNESYAQKHANRCKNAQVTSLYTHSVKELTDDEIIAIVNETLESWNTREAMLKFARSLLRKAQEK